MPPARGSSLERAMLRACFPNSLYQDAAPAQTSGTKLLSVVWKRVHRSKRNLHEMIAESFCCWLYSRLLTMKARSFIVRVLLLALVLAPSAIRASARQLSPPSCRVAKWQSPASRASVKASGSLVQLVASTPGHHAPAPRLHRFRGKKISIERGLVATPRRITSTHFLVSDARVSQMELDGPNPSRGPPSQFPL